MTPPALPAVLAYLASADAGLPSWPEDTVQAALDAEVAAQAAVVRFPAAATAYPADLAEALYRRVAHNLALRGLPLGVQASMSEVAVTTTRVGGLDAEVRRLEAPYRRLVVG